jgi:hypothetical protein
MFGVGVPGTTHWLKRDSGRFALERFVRRIETESESEKPRKNPITIEEPTLKDEGSGTRKSKGKRDPSLRSG